MQLPRPIRAPSVALAILLLVAASCGGHDGGALGRADQAPPAQASCQPMPIGQRAAAVLMVGIGGATTAEAPLPAAVASLGVAGVILMGANVVDAAQVEALVDGLRAQAPRPLLVAVDEEGGRVSRLRPIIGPTPPARALGQRPLPEITTVAEERAARLRGLGFDLVLAPVVDAEGGPAGGAIGDRAFGATPADAGVRAAAFAEGLRRAGLAAAAKHFPGQGGLADSHDGTVVSLAPLAEVRRTAGAGFAPVLRAGVPAVMMSHVTFSALGSGPASLEPAAYQLLRSMGFDGVAITDAVGMSAVVDRWPLPEATVMALAAGADLVLAVPGDSAQAMIDAIVAAVASGRLPEARLNEAVRRVASLGGRSGSSLICG